MTSLYEDDLINAIADRAIKIAEDQGVEYSKTSAVMDLTSAHEQLPLRLDELLSADKFNFTHDVFGIANHMDRSTFPGTLTGCFVPRYVCR